MGRRKAYPSKTARGVNTERGPRHPAPELKFYFLSSRVARYGKLAGTARRQKISSRRLRLPDPAPDAWLAAGGLVDFLSRPKPLRLEWRGAGEANVLAASLLEGEAIYVWLKTPDGPEPRAYVPPWGTKTAQQLQDALQKGQATGRGVRMSKRFDPGLDDREPKFYAAPQTALPDKDYPGTGTTNTLVFQRRAD